MKINNETKIGIMMAAVLALLIGITLKSGDFHLSRKGTLLKVMFNNIDGVNLNSPVMFNGFEVGIVEDIVIKEEGDQTLMECHLWIHDTVNVRTSTKAFIKNLGFMGEKYIGLVSTKEPGRYLQDGELIIGEEPADFGRLIIKGEEIAKNVNEISANLNERLAVNKQSIDETITNFKDTLGNLASITRNVDERLAANEGPIDDIVLRLKASAVNLDELTCDLKNNPWKLTYRPKDKRKACEPEIKP